ncbi:MAG TPA: hypothetical protein DC001_02160, partial [Clostridiales bacterium]|nr:hypothetical protein [Clostridiales bacterium]
MRGGGEKLPWPFRIPPQRVNAGASVPRCGMNIVLASGSPRRRELMEMLGVRNLVVVPAVGEEVAVPGRGPEETVMALSAAKAAEVAAKRPQGDLIIAADTIVWLDGEILGKPRDREDAAAMLGKLSGREHTVYSGLLHVQAF